MTAVLAAAESTAGWPVAAVAIVTILIIAWALTRGEGR